MSAFQEIPEWLDHLELGVRAQRAVLEAGCQSLADILDKTRTDWLRIRGCGVTTVAEIEDMKKSLGLIPSKHVDEAVRIATALERIATALGAMARHFGAAS